MGFLCRSMFQVTLFLFLPVLSSRHSCTLSRCLSLTAWDRILAETGRNIQGVNDTIFLTDHYVYGLNNAFKYIISSADGEGMILKTDTIAEPAEAQPEKMNNNQKDQFIQQHSHEPAVPSALIWHKRKEEIGIDQLNA